MTGELLREAARDSVPVEAHIACRFASGAHFFYDFGFELSKGEVLQGFKTIQSL